MRITISSSSNNNIDKLYLDESKKVLEYLASEGHDLNWGSGNNSIMGLSYEVFDEYGRNMYGYTTEKYKDEIDDLPNAKHQIYEDTLLLKKGFYDDADVLLCLPGGTGTVSEFFTYLEEARSNDNPKPIIILNINHQFDLLFELIEDLIKNKFNSTSIYDYYNVANSYEEFVEIFENIKRRVK